MFQYQEQPNWLLEMMGLLSYAMEAQNWTGAVDVRPSSTGSPASSFHVSDICIPAMFAIISAVQTDLENRSQKWSCLGWAMREQELVN